jgi:DNA-binding NtrC family response regulator
LLLPSVSEAPETDIQPTHSEKLRGTETILVVEDDEPVRRLAVRLLEMLGYQVLEASDATEALRIAGERDTQIHAVLTDVVMPDKQGPALVTELAELHPEIRSIYMSGYSRGAVEMDETIVLVQKPFSRNDLARKVREVLDRSG